MAPRPNRNSRRHGSDAHRIRDLADTAGHDHRPDAAENSRLLEAAARGDRGARGSLTEAHLGWVVSEAEKRAGRGLSQSDLFQEGTIGLMHAIATFRGGGEADFEAFAREQVAGHMDHALREEQRTVRNGEMLLQAARDYEAAEMSLKRELGRDGTDAELAKKLEWSLERTIGIGELVAEARRRYDEEMLQFLEPEDIGAVDLEEIEGQRDNRDG